MGKAADVRGMPGWLVLMGLLTMTVPLGIDMYLPALPEIAGYFQTDVSAVERSLPVFLLGLALGQLVFGPLSDRYGRSLPLYLGIVLYTLGALGCGWSSSLDELMIWRLLQALGCASCMVVPRAVIRDYYQTQAAARAMSMLMLITGAAPLLAPTLGGQVLWFANWQMIFYVQAAFGLAVMATMFVTMKESLAPENRRPVGVFASIVTYGSLFKHRQFMAMSMAGGLAMAGLFAYLTGSARVFIDVYGLSPQWYGPLFGGNAVVMMIMSQVNSRLLRNHHPQRVLQILFYLWPFFALTALVLSVAGILSFGLLLVSLTVFMAGLGFISPNCAAVSLAGQSHRLGAASALMGALQFFAGMLGGLAVSFWRTESALNMVAVMSVCMIAASICGLWGLRMATDEQKH